MKTRKLGVLAISVTLILALGLTPALAADYPKRPITLICPWGAGGGTDAVSRIIATLLKKDLGVPVNVVNRTGGSGAVGHTAIATAKPDGYTIGMPTVEITMMHWMGLTKITYQDMTPVAMVNFDPAGINVRTDSPWKTYKDLEMYVRDNPGKLKDLVALNNFTVFLIKGSYKLEICANNMCYCCCLHDGGSVTDCNSHGSCQ